MKSNGSSIMAAFTGIRLHNLRRERPQLRTALFHCADSQTSDRSVSCLKPQRLCHSRSKDCTVLQPVPLCDIDSTLARNWGNYGHCRRPFLSAHRRKEHKAYSYSSVSLPGSYLHAATCSAQAERYFKLQGFACSCVEEMTEMTEVCVADIAGHLHQLD